MAYNVARQQRMLTLSVVQLRLIAQSGSLASAAARAELARREAAA